MVSWKTACPCMDQLYFVLRELPAYKAREVVDNCAPVFGRFPTLLPTKHPYTYSGAAREVVLLCISGTVPIIVGGFTYYTPVLIFIQPDFPREPPLAYVNPTPDMTVVAGHAYVHRDRRITTPGLESWTPTSSLADVVMEMSAIFSSSPPLVSSAVSPAPAPAASPYYAPHVMPHVDYVQSFGYDTGHTPDYSIVASRGRVDAPAPAAYPRPTPAPMPAPTTTLPPVPAPAPLPTPNPVSATASHASTPDRPDASKLVLPPVSRPHHAHHLPPITGLSGGGGGSSGLSLPARAGGRSGASATAFEKPIHATCWLDESNLVIGRELGKGSCGVTYAAKLNGFTDVCAKTLHALMDPVLFGVIPGSPEHQKLISDMMAEADMLSALRHDSIITFYGVVGSEASGPKWLVTQLADGTLDKYLRGLGRCPLDVFIGIMEDVLGGLVFLHTLKPNAVIHRDLKPDNIFYFLKRGALTVKIGDVGLSRFTNAAGRLGAGYGGAVFYLAPEVVKGSFDAKVDVFSFGIMMAEMALSYVSVPGYELMPAPDRVYGMDNRFGMVDEAVARLRVVNTRLADLLAGCCHRKPKLRLSSVDALGQLKGVKY